MIVDRDKLLADLEEIVSNARERIASLKLAADLLKSCGRYRWVGLYEVDHAARLVNNVVWSGPGAPEYPTFPVTKGLTAAAVADRRTANVGDIASDPRYLTAFSTTRSEIIVPVFDQARGVVIGTIDIESETANAFGADVQALLETCSDVIRPLWKL